MLEFSAFTSCGWESSAHWDLLTKAPGMANKCKCFF